jgi:hypothetical protein
MTNEELGRALRQLRLGGMRRRPLYGRFVNGVSVSPFGQVLSAGSSSAPEGPYVSRPLPGLTTPNFHRNRLTYTARSPR